MTTSHGINHFSHAHIFRNNHSATRISSGNNQVTQNVKGTSIQKGHDVLKRRQSLPVVCPSNVLGMIAENVEAGGSLFSPSSRKRGVINNGLNVKQSNTTEIQSVSNTEKEEECRNGKNRVYRRASVAAFRKDSCKVS